MPSGRHPSAEAELQPPRLSAGWLLPEHRGWWVCWLAMTSIWLIAWFATPVAAEHRRIAFNTLLFSGLSSLLATGIGYWLNRQLAGRDQRLAVALHTAMMALILLPLHLHVACWDAFLGKLGWWQLATQQAPLARGMLAGTWIQSVAGIPWVLTILAFSLPRGWSSMEAMASLDCSPAQVFWRITLRSHLPAIVLCFVWCFVYASREIAVTDIYQIGTLSEEVYLRISGGGLAGVWWKGDSPIDWFLQALFWLSFPVWLGLSLFGVLRLAIATSDGSRPRTICGVRPRRAMPYFVAVVVAMTILCVPLANLVARGGLSLVRTEPSAAAPSSDERVAGFRTEFRWQHLFENLASLPAEYGQEFYWSVMLALMTSVVAGSLALIAAVAGRRRPSLATAGLLGATLGLAVPGPILGLLVYKWLNLFYGPWSRALIDRSLLGPALATSLVAFGPCWLLVVTAVRRIPNIQLDAASLECGQSIYNDGRLVLPQIARSVCGCFVVAFVLGYNELSASFASLPAGVDTLPRRLLGQMHAGVNDQTAALSLANVVGTLLCGWLLIGLLKPKK